MPARFFHPGNRSISTTRPVSAPFFAMYGSASPARVSKSPSSSGPDGLTWRMPVALSSVALIIAPSFRHPPSAIRHALALATVLHELDRGQEQRFVLAEIGGVFVV